MRAQQQLLQLRPALRGAELQQRVSGARLHAVCAGRLGVSAADAVRVRDDRERELVPAARGRDHWPRPRLAQRCGPVDRAGRDCECVLVVLRRHG